MNDLILGFLKATELAAIASANFIGRMNSHAADQAAVDAIRKSLNEMNIKGKIATGEGEIDEAPMLFIGEVVGKKSLKIGIPKLDIAVDPIEGTERVAKNKSDAFSVLAVAGKDCFLHTPDCYMNKIVVGPDARHAKIDINSTVLENLTRVARAKNKQVKDLVVSVLDRPRHLKLIQDIQAVGAKLNLIDDGDILAAIATCLPNAKVDVLMGIGGAPEGVISAAAIKCLGGNMQSRLILNTPELRMRASKMKIDCFDRAYNLDEMAKGDVIFVATGITDGFLLKGVRGNTTSSVVFTMNYKKYIETDHGKKENR